MAHRGGCTRDLIGRCLLETESVLAEMSFPCNIEQARKLLRKASERVTDTLSAEDSLTKDSNSIDGKTPVEIIQQVLRLVHNRFNFDHTLICVPDSSSSLVAIAGVGKNAGQVTSKFRCYGTRPDLLRAIAAGKIDVYISDTALPAYAKLLPEWYAGLVGAKSFMMLPLMAGDKLLGILYGDYCDLQPLAPEGLATGDMVTWRSQLVTALQSGNGKR